MFNIENQIIWSDMFANDIKKAIEFLGTSVNDLNSKDYIAAQHLLRIIDELEIAMIDLSVKADENVKIINAFEKKERDLNAKENKKQRK